MSISLVVSWAGSAAPTREGWQQQIAAAGLPLQLGELDESGGVEGFWSAVWQGRPSGFDWQLRPADADLGGPPGGCAAVIVGRGDNTPAALAAAAALAELMDGTLEDPQSGDTLCAREAMPWARIQITAWQNAHDEGDAPECAADRAWGRTWSRAGRIVAGLLILALLAVGLTLLLR